MFGHLFKITGLAAGSGQTAASINIYAAATLYTGCLLRFDLIRILQSPFDNGDAAGHVGCQLHIMRHHNQGH